MTMNPGTGRGKGPRKPAKKKLTLEFILRFYDAFLREHEQVKIAAALETSAATLIQWIKKFPNLQLARDMAVKRREETKSFGGYVYKHLSAEAKQTWDEIQFWQEGESTEEKISKLLDGKTKTVRQELFVHALINYSFNVSEACRIAGVSRATMESWRDRDEGFRKMLEEIEWHKCNFFESALLDLVAEKNPGAVMFVNRTKNAHRGYNEKLTVETSDSMSGINIDELDLSIDTRKEILAAIRKKKATDVAQAVIPQKAIDV